MDKRTKGCLLIGIGVTLLLVVVGAALIGGAGYWLYQQFSIETGEHEPVDAAREMDAVRARFGSQQPFIAFKGDRAQVRDDVAPGTGETPAPIESLQVMAFEADDRQLVRVTVPFWLLRLAPEGRISASSDALRDVKGVDRLTVKQIEALGPGLLIDRQEKDGSRVLVWTE